MATPPFSSTLVTDLAGKTAWRFYAELGPVVTVRGFCCDSPNDGVDPDGKIPVAHIDLDPNPALVGETVNYDGTASYDPDGSVTAWAWTFESHSPSSGTAIAGTLNYATAGVYTIQLIVTDGTGNKSSPARKELTVTNPTFDAYAATETGVYYGTAAGGTTTWTDKNSGLSGADLQVNDVAVDPYTRNNAAASRVLWRATDGGVQVSNDGGATWADKSPTSVSNQWGDSPAPDAGSLNYTHLLFAGDKLFVGANWQNGGGDYRAWVFYTTDWPAMRTSTAGQVIDGEIFHITHEAGDLSEYTTTVTDSGDLSVSGAAALVGFYGLAALIDDTTDIYGQISFTQLTSTAYRFRFYFDTNGLTMATNDMLRLAIIRSSAGWIATVNLQYDGASYEIALSVMLDSTSYNSTSYYDVTDGVHYIEALVQYASSAVANDAAATLWIDGTQVQQLTGLDIYDLDKPSSARLGAAQADAGTSGTLYLDDFVLRADTTEIGPTGVSFAWSELSTGWEA